jgi:hypothetical protein
MVPVLESFTATGASTGASAIAVELMRGLNSIPTLLFIPQSGHPHHSLMQESYQKAPIIQKNYMVA